ncbi:MAG TPA: (Fe-S)-binding protein [Nitrospirota bacterium]
MTKNKHLEKYRDAIYKCIRCGACRAVCPTFGEELSETAVARGRMTLVEAVLNGELELTDAFEQTVFRCAMCGACKANCPSGVDVPAILDAARQDLVEEKRSVPVIRFLARKSLKDKPTMDHSYALMALGRAAYGPLAATPLAKYLPYQYKDFKRQFPKIPMKQLLKRLPELSKAAESRGVVALFAGCAINYIFPEVGEAAVRVLNAAGYDVLVVKDEVCCGKPLKSLGEADAYRELAEKTAALFGGLKVDAILTGCPTCALTLREDYPKILPESKTVRALADKVEDINRFLITKTDILQRLEAEGLQKLSVTYHDPCHLNHGMGVTREPRELINAATGGGLVEMGEAGRCCGFGGVFSFLNYELSGRISSRKAENIIKTGAQAVATACPGCMMHLQDALKQAGAEAKTVHTVQLLDAALSNKKAKKK